MVVVAEEQADEAAAERNENCDDDDEVGVVEATPRPCGSLATDGALILVIGVIYGIMYVWCFKGHVIRKSDCHCSKNLGGNSASYVCKFIVCKLRF